MKICIDAGHYAEYNQSPVCASYYESYMTWYLHRMIGAILEVEGAEVVYTRDNQRTDKPVYDRGRCAAGCDVMVSIHSNASSNTRKRSIHVYRSVETPGAATALSNAIAARLAPCMDADGVGDLTNESSNHPGRDYYGIFKGATDAKCPIVILIEHSYHTNELSTHMLRDWARLSAIAQIDADAIIECCRMCGYKDNGSTVINGARGDAVRRIQHALRMWGYNVDADGIYGDKTETAVRHIQLSHGLTVDGKTGKKTKEVLWGE